MIGKKGLHIEIMISFGIFITFLVFLYSILQPAIGAEKNKELALDDLVESLVELLGTDVTNYTSGSVRTIDADFLTEISSLIDRYDSDYSGLKSDLEVATANDFGISFRKTDESVISPSTESPQSVSIYAKEIPTYYTGGDENVLLGFIVLEIW